MQDGSTLPRHMEALLLENEVEFNGRACAEHEHGGESGIATFLLSKENYLAPQPQATQDCVDKPFCSLVIKTTQGASVSFFKPCIPNIWSI